MRKTDIIHFQKLAPREGQLQRAEKSLDGHGMKRKKSISHRTGV